MLPVFPGCQSNKTHSKQGQGFAPRMDSFAFSSMANQAIRSPGSLSVYLFRHLAYSTHFYISAGASFLITHVREWECFMEVVYPMERRTRLELALTAWKAVVLPLH